MKRLNEMTREELTQFLHNEGIDTDRLTNYDVETIQKEIAEQTAWNDKRNTAAHLRESADRDYRDELIERFLNLGDGQQRPCYCPYCGSPVYAEVSCTIYHQVDTVRRTSRAYPNASTLSRHHVRPMVESETAEYWRCSESCGFGNEGDETLFELCRLPSPEEGSVLIHNKVHVEISGMARGGDGKLTLSLTAHKLAPMEDRWLPIVTGEKTAIFIETSGAVPGPQIRTSVLQTAASYLDQQIENEAGSLAPVTRDGETELYEVVPEVFQRLEQNITWPIAS